MQGHSVYIPSICLTCVAGMVTLKSQRAHSIGPAASLIPRHPWRLNLPFLHLTLAPSWLMGGSISPRCACFQFELLHTVSRWSRPLLFGPNSHSRKSEMSSSSCASICICPQIARDLCICVSSVPEKGRTDMSGACRRGELCRVRSWTKKSGLELSVGQYDILPVAATSRTSSISSLQYTFSLLGGQKACTNVGCTNVTCHNLSER